MKILVLVVSADEQRVATWLGNLEGNLDIQGG